MYPEEVFCVRQTVLYLPYPHTWWNHCLWHHWRACDEWEICVVLTRTCGMACNNFMILADWFMNSYSWRQAKSTTFIVDEGIFFGTKWLSDIDSTGWKTFKNALNCIFSCIFLVQPNFWSKFYLKDTRSAKIIVWILVNDASQNEQAWCITKLGYLACFNASIWHYCLCSMDNVVWCTGTATTGNTVTCLAMFAGPAIAARSGARVNLLKNLVSWGWFCKFFLCL